MKKIVSTTWLVVLLLSLNAQTIPTDRRVNWQRIIQNYTYKTPARVVSILDFGGVADGETDNSDVLKQAVASFQHRAGTVLFPAGTYLFNNSVVLPDSIQLKGAGSDIIPAKQRYESGGLLTVCPEAVTAVRKHLGGDAAWQIGPNPVHGDLYISTLAGEESGTFIVRIFNIQGKLLSTKKYQKKNVVVPLDKNLKSGVYLLEISSKKSRFLKKIVLAR